MDVMDPLTTFEKKKKSVSLRGKREIEEGREGGCGQGRSGDGLGTAD